MQSITRKQLELNSHIWCKIYAKQNPNYNTLTANLKRL